jgi:hypothetical protein
VAAVLRGRVLPPGRTRSPDMLNELIESAMHSSPQGFVGVSLIAIYFCVIVATAFYRIGKGDHMHH